MSTANVNNNLVITCRRSLKGALSYERNLRPETSLCSWIIRSPLLVQPGLSCYSEVAARKRADESSRAIDSIKESVSFLQASIFSAPLIGSILNAIVRKGRTLGDHKPNVMFVVQWLVHVRSRTVCIRLP